MVAQNFLTKSALWSLAIFAILSLQSADADPDPYAYNPNCTNTYYDNNYVPGWGIALIVMVALLLLGMLCSCGLVPLMMKKSGGGCCAGQ